MTSSAKHPPILTIDNVTKYYGKNLALNKINFSLYPGEIIGFLGVNGAGKSTLMNIITGYLAPTTGNILLNGQSTLIDPIIAQKHIGYLPENPPLYHEMTPFEYLSFIAQIRLPKATKEQQQKAITSIMDTLALHTMQHRLIAHLSKGYRQRVGIASTLIGSPSLLIWDEPTAGLDPQQLQEIHQLLRNLRTHHTILLSSHMLHEIESLCDRIIVLHQGEIIQSSTPQELKSICQKFQPVIQIEFDFPITKETLSQLQLDLPQDVTIHHPVLQKGLSYMEVQFPTTFTEDSRKVLWQVIKKNQWDILHFHAQEISLEDSFLSITQMNHKEA
ncbi:ABC transporter ATP-binding protein [Entomospira nematocerorum]|uniref:ABC transporter ATP-binding protein n=1 Tax=Entomospira nematocerorum TaxID=2719987 RepID=A0A968KTE6_9SPIO|nr:ABC transporter ATP-binding protein [Entomospira nematocera]NIZ47326.1 ABC transporter ATP-binding protein [Entomospira nematocera]WDI34132.1 ABC transporter ATP-binding protein [Entomospira nematocera]